jgi:hypothetical protein
MTEMDSTPAWCSDAVATLLRQLAIGYVALSPGSSFRGLHESLVNLLGNRDPRCCCACTRSTRLPSRTAGRR